MIEMYFNTHCSGIKDNTSRAFPVEHAFTSGDEAPFQLWRVAWVPIQCTEKAILPGFISLIDIVNCHIHLPIITLLQKVYEKNTFSSS
jgi:hypothetical protein